MEWLWIVLAHPATKGALTGAIAAATIDRQAFKGWNSFDEALAYRWDLAAFRWFQGAVIGAFAAVGLP